MLSGCSSHVLSQHGCHLLAWRLPCQERGRHTFCTQTTMRLQACLSDTCPGAATANNPSLGLAWLPELSCRDVLTGLPCLHASIKLLWIGRLTPQPISIELSWIACLPTAAQSCNNNSMTSPGYAWLHDSVDQQQQ